MYRILAFFIGFHWTVHFALLAVRSLGASSGGAATAMAYGLAAVLFLWMLVTVMLDRHFLSSDADDVGRLAFAAATGVLTLVLLGGAAQPTGGLMPAVSLQLAALLVSYVAVCAERHALAGRVGDDADASSSAMALGAAHTAMLSRLSGRPSAEGPA